MAKESGIPDAMWGKQVHALMRKLQLGHKMVCTNTIGTTTDLMVGHGQQWLAGYRWFIDGGAIRVRVTIWPRKYKLQYNTDKELWQRLERCELTLGLTQQNQPCSAMVGQSGCR